MNKRIAAIVGTAALLAFGLAILDSHMQGEEPPAATATTALQPGYSYGESMRMLQQTWNGGAPDQRDGICNGTYEGLLDASALRQFKHRACSVPTPVPTPAWTPAPAPVPTYQETLDWFHQIWDLSGQELRDDYCNDPSGLGFIHGVVKDSDPQVVADFTAEVC